MSPIERQAEFKRLFERVQGRRNVDKIREVARILCCAENTVRIYRLSNTHRIIPQSKLNILRREIERIKEPD